jgi:hypothetical protein
MDEQEKLRISLIKMTVYADTLLDQISILESSLIDLNSKLKMKEDGLKRISESETVQEARRLARIVME